VLFVNDTIQLTQRWSVLGGVRDANYEQHGYSTWEHQYADYVTPGDPRTLSLNARIDF
jgi:outer membrane receptor for monomeric catechols